MIKTISEYKKKTKTVAEVLRENSPYLKAGKYHIGTNLRYVYRDDSESLKYLEDILFKNNHQLKPAKDLSNIIKALISKRTLNIYDTGQSIFEGSICLFSNSDTGVREKNIIIFDFENLEVLTIHSNAEKLSKRIESYNYFSQFFNIPNITSYDMDRRFSMEQLVLARPKNSWTDIDYRLVIESIFNTYNMYYDKYSKDKDISYINTREILNRLNENNLTLKLSQTLEELIPNDLMNTCFPVTEQHGDLWFFNTIIEEKSNIIYFIDWENSKTYIFFSDLFWWMKSEAISRKNFDYIEKYLSGEYDEYFTDIFSKFNLDYNIRLRDAYYYIFIAAYVDEFLSFRVSPKNDNPNYRRHVVENIFMPFLNRVRDISKGVLKEG